MCFCCFKNRALISWKMLLQTHWNTCALQDYDIYWSVFVAPFITCGSWWRWTGIRVGVFGWVLCWPVQPFVKSYDLVLLILTFSSVYSLNLQFVSLAFDRSITVKWYPSHALLYKFPLTRMADTLKYTKFILWLWSQTKPTIIIHQHITADCMLMWSDGLAILQISCNFKYL